jgi:hypothetical protein
MHVQKVKYLQQVVNRAQHAVQVSMLVLAILNVWIAKLALIRIKKDKEVAFLVLVDMFPMLVLRDARRVH